MDDIDPNQDEEARMSLQVRLIIGGVVRYVDLLRVANYSFSTLSFALLVQKIVFLVATTRFVIGTGSTK